MQYKRILLKLSGEMLAGGQGFGLDKDTIDLLVDSVVEVHKAGVQIGIVIGAGNIFRGADSAGGGLDRTTGDYMGMLGTLFNCLALQDFIERKGVRTRVMSALQINAIAEPYIKRRAIRHLEKGRIVIFGCGTGNPYFSTDTAAALRGNEIGADVVLKGTKVDYVYDKDPHKFDDAKPYLKVNYMEALQKQLKIMDAAAISLCMENSLPIRVFNMGKLSNLMGIIKGQDIGTLVSDEE